MCVYIYIYIIFFKYIPICTLTLRTFCFCSPCISVTCLSCAPCCLPNAMHHKFMMLCQAKESTELLYEKDIFCKLDLIYIPVEFSDASVLLPYKTFREL